MLNSSQHVFSNMHLFIALFHFNWLRQTETLLSTLPTFLCNRPSWLSKTYFKYAEIRKKQREDRFQSFARGYKVKRSRKISCVFQYIFLIYFLLFAVPCSQERLDVFSDLFTAACLLFVVHSSLCLVLSTYCLHCLILCIVLLSAKVPHNFKWLNFTTALLLAVTCFQFFPDW
jgi:hypothetical protein